MQSVVYLQLYCHRWWIIYGILCKTVYINVVIDLVQICTNCTRNRSHACMLCMNPHMSLTAEIIAFSLLHSMHVNDRVREGEGEKWGRACNSASKHGGRRVNYHAAPALCIFVRKERGRLLTLSVSKTTHWMVYIYPNADEDSCMVVQTFGIIIQSVCKCSCDLHKHPPKVTCMYMQWNDWCTYAHQRHSMCN